MVAKVPCRECGAMILPTTAETNGGICMACKQGIRKDIEASRARHQALRQYDPVRELWVSLVKRSSSDPTLESMSFEERTYFTVCLLEGEIHNGGFDQFFTNSSGNHFPETVAGLREIGAHRSLKIVDDAARLIFGESGPPRERMLRWDRMKQFTEGSDQSGSKAEALSQLDHLDKQFCNDEDGLHNLLEAFAKRHELIKPFEKEE